MGALEDLKMSKAWRFDYDLPLFPEFNNPWIYGAYALKVLKESGISAAEEMSLVNRFESFASLCRVEPGLFNRWPNGDGGVTSHDELIGMAYISSSLAYEILEYLEKTDGVYLNKPEEKVAHPDWEIRFNVYRMIFLKPFLKASCLFSLNLFSQFQFSSFLLWDVFTTRSFGLSDAGGRLRIWIMLETMEKKGPVVSSAIWYWRKKMADLGYTPSNMLRSEPGVEALFKNAPENF